MKCRGIRFTDEHCIVVDLMGEILGESEVSSSKFALDLQPFNILVCNIRCVMYKLGEFTCLIEYHYVHMILLQASWLDASIENVMLPNFVVLSRRDRSDDPNRGGIIAFVRCDVKNVMYLHNTMSSERSWHIIQRDSATIAICNWYFSPQASLDVIEILELEIVEMLCKNMIISSSQEI